MFFNRIENSENSFVKMSSDAPEVVGQDESELEQKGTLMSPRKTLKNCQDNNDVDKENMSSVDQLECQKPSTSSGTLNLSHECVKRKRIDAEVKRSGAVDVALQTDDVYVGPLLTLDELALVKPGKSSLHDWAVETSIILQRTLSEKQHLIETIKGRREKLDAARTMLETTKKQAENLGIFELDESKQEDEVREEKTKHVQGEEVDEIIEILDTDDEEELGQEKTKTVSQFEYKYSGNDEMTKVVSLTKTTFNRINANTVSENYVGDYKSEKDHKMKQADEQKDEDGKKSIENAASKESGEKGDRTGEDENKKENAGEKRKLEA